MNKKIERQINSFKNNLNNMPYLDRLKEYNKSLQVIENSYDAYAYFRLVIFDKLIYQTISNQEELKRAFKEVRTNISFFLNQIKLLFPKKFFLLEEEKFGYDYKMEHTIIERFKMKIGAEPRIDYYLTIAKKISSIINAVDYVYLSNINIQEPDIYLGKTLTINLETNEMLSFDHVVYNIKQSIKRIFKLYE